MEETIKKARKPRKKKDNRGGARPGSGRPKGENPKKQLCIYISEDTRRKYLLLKEKGFDMGKQLEQRIDELALLMGVK